MLRDHGPGALPSHLAPLAAAAVALLLAGLVADVLILAFLSPRAAWAQRVQTLRRRPWTSRDAQLLLAVSLLALTAGLAGSRLIAAAADMDATWLPVILQSLFLYGSSGLTVVVLLSRKSSSWRAAFGLGPPQLGRRAAQALFFYVAAVPAVAAAGLVWRLLLKLAGYPLTLQDAVLLFARPSPLFFRIFLLFLALIAAPVVEEMLFRGILLPLAAKRLRPLVAVAIVSLGFASVHAHLPSLGPLFAIACAFALAYIYTGSLAVPIFMHALFNGINVLLLFLVRDVPGIGPEAWIVALAPGLY